MAFAHVMTTLTSGYSGLSSWQRTALPATVAGNLVVIHVYVNNSSAVNITSITDDKGNAYALSYKQSDTYSKSCHQWHGVQSTGGATVVTINFSASVGGRFGVSEFSGGATTNASVFDTAAGSHNFSDYSMSAALSPSASGKLVSASLCSSSANTFTAGTDYTLGSAGSGRVLTTEYRLSSTTSETAPAQLSSSADWIEVAASYNPLSSDQGNMFLFL